jgi:hypothetical protein
VGLLLLLLLLLLQHSQQKAILSCADHKANGEKTRIPKCSKLQLLKCLIQYTTESTLLPVSVSLCVSHSY